MVIQLRSKLSIALLALLLWAGVKNNAVAQCNTNVSVCGTGGSTGPFNFSSPGAVVSSCLDFWGPNVGYIMLYITQSGNLNIQIDGSSTTGFLDVAVFNIPPGSNPCTAIANTSNEIGCNYATFSSGCNQFGNAFGCISSVPAPAVTAGQVLMIVVENWSGSSNNFTLQMGTTPGSASAGVPNASINPAGPFCSTSPSSQLTAGNNGGTWSGPGTSASGMFNPAAAGVGTHTVNYTIGTAPCQSTSTRTVQVVSTPSITVSSATICPGGTATLTATPNAAGGNYVWNPGGLTGQSITVSPGSTTNYTCTYSFGGCTSTPQVGTVTVGGAVTLSVNSATVCPGNSATLTASGGSGYTWAPATGLSATTGTTVTANPATTTTYTVSNGGACVGSATSTVTVSPGPTVTVNSPTICVGGSATVTASGATTYTWSPAAGLSATTGATVTANPTATTVYTVTGSSAASCTGTRTFTVTVNPLPVLTVNSATICTAGTATLTASGASTYTWSPATGLSAATGATVTSTPASTITYTVTGSSAAGCNGTATSTVTVNALPVVTVNSATICPAAGTTLTASGATTYSWSPATGLSATAGATVTASPAATTTYTITGTTAGCNASATSTVTVSPAPTVTVNSPTICAGTSSVLTAAGAITYTWSPAAGLSATTGSTVTANPATTTTYTVVGSSAAGCPGTITSTVTVNPLPVVTVNSATICPAGTASLTATGATTYSWTPSTGLSATTGATVTANPASTTTYTITGTTAGCNGSATSTVTVNPTPTITSLTGTICPTMTCSITAYGATTYTWSPATGLDTINGATVIASPPVTTTYTITGTSLGCNGTGTTTVTVYPQPVVTVNSPTTCVGSPVGVTASGCTMYFWEASPDLSGSGASIMANPSTTTSYTVLGIDAVGCGDAKTFTVTVNPLPVVTVDPDTICAGASATLTATGATTYSWTPSTGLSAATGASVTANPASTTIYTVTGTTNNCNGLQTTTVTVNPIPVINVNSPGICVSGTATVTATGATTYSWTPATNLSATTGASVVANPPATTTYTVTGTSLGCVGTATSTVTINAIPTVTVNSPVICLGNSTTLTATGGTSFSWNPSTGLSSTTGTSVTANPLMTTTYTVTETSSGCNGTSTSTVTVNPLPIVSASNTGPYCVNETIVLNCPATGTYQWQGPNIYSSSLQSPQITNATTAHSGIFTVNVTDANGCVNSATTQVIVNPLPIVSVSSNSPVCVNETLNLTATGGTGFSWLGPGSFTSTLPGPSLTAAALTMGGTYTVVVTDANGCQNAGFTTAIINDLPAAPAVTGPTYCVGAVAASLNTTTPSAGTLNWYGTNPSGSPSASPTVPSTAVAGSTTYYVSQTIAGCEGAQSPVTVIVRPLPTATLNTIPTQCVPLCDTFVLSSVSSIVSYQWNMGNGMVTTNGNTHAHCYGQSGEYDVTVTITDNNGCTNAIPFANWVHVSEIPTAEFSWSPNPVSIFDPNVTFYSYSFGSGLHSFEWNIYHGDTLLHSTDTEQPGYVFQEADTFHVELTVVSAHGCSNSTIKPLVIQDEHAVYIPNAFSPDNDNINESFKVVGTGIKEVTMTIFDRWGGVIFRSNDQDKGWNGRNGKDDKVEKGVYIYKAEIVDYRGVKSLKTGHVTVVR